MATYGRVTRLEAVPGGRITMRPVVSTAVEGVLEEMYEIRDESAENLALQRDIAASASTMVMRYAGGVWPDRLSLDQNVQAIWFGGTISTPPPGALLGDLWIRRVA